MPIEHPITCYILRLRRNTRTEAWASFDLQWKIKNQSLSRFTNAMVLRLQTRPKLGLCSSVSASKESRLRVVAPRSPSRFARSNCCRTLLWLILLGVSHVRRASSTLYPSPLPSVIEYATYVANIWFCFFLIKGLLLTSLSLDVRFVSFSRIGSPLTPALRAQSQVKLSGPCLFFWNWNNNRSDNVTTAEGAGRAGYLDGGGGTGPPPGTCSCLSICAWQLLLLTR